MNMQAILKQAQAMQKDMLKAKEEIDNSIYTGRSSAVVVEINGKKEIKSLKIESDKDIVEDLEILQDMIIIAINDAMKQIDQDVDKKLGKYSSAMPGLF